jgi:XTP/dITP diphosphohydrolase
MKIVFSTGNSGKLREASEILGRGFELVSPAEMGMSEEIPETGKTLKDNSLQKAQYVYGHCGGVDCFADDTGLEVEILGGAPGVHTARYAGPSKDFNSNMDKLLDEISRKEMEASFAREMGFATPKATRKARFRTVVTLMFGGSVHFFEGVMNGRIAVSKAGKGGFGYDPVFMPDEFPSQTAAEIGEDQKNAISHRGKALRAMAEFLHGSK